MKTKRINPGIYTIKAGSRTFEVEQFPDGYWLTFESHDNNGREYWRDYRTLRAAKADIARWYGTAEEKRQAAYDAANKRHPLRALQLVLQLRQAGEE